MDKIFRSLNSRVSEGLHFGWGAVGWMVSAQLKSEPHARVLCIMSIVFEIIRKGKEGYVVREQPRRITDKVDVRNECIRFLDTRRRHTLTIR